MNQIVEVDFLAQGRRIEYCTVELLVLLLDFGYGLDWIGMDWNGMARKGWMERLEYLGRDGMGIYVYLCFERGVMIIIR